MSGFLEMLSKNKMILVLIGVVIGGFILYRSIAPSAGTSLIQQQTQQGGAAEARAGERAILDTLFQLRAITLAGSIFNNPAFAALRDFRTEIVAEPIGRTNPFAPIDGMATSSIPARQIEQTTKSMPRP